MFLLTSPLYVADDGRPWIEGGAGEGAACGGSGTLLDKILENAIGLRVLVGFSSSFVYVWGSRYESERLVPREAGRSEWPFITVETLLDF